MTLRSVAWWLLALLCAAMGFYALVSYTSLPPGAAVHPQMQAVYRANPVPLYAHVFGAAAAMLLGPLQFWPALRLQRPRLHRAMGRMYLLIGVGLGGAAGLWLAFLAYGGPVSTSGFALLAVIWIGTGWLAFRAAFRRDFRAHRAWMVRNMSLTFAAVTLRVWLAAGMALQLPFDAVYPALAWLSWVPNLMVAEWLVRRPG